MTKSDQYGQLERAEGPLDVDALVLPPHPPDEPLRPGAPPSPQSAFSYTTTPTLRVTRACTSGQGRVERGARKCLGGRWAGGDGGVDGRRAPSTSKQQPSRTFLGTCTRTLMRFREGLGAPAPPNHANARGALPSSPSHPAVPRSIDDWDHDWIGQSSRITLANQN